MYLRLHPRIVVGIVLICSIGSAHADSSSAQAMIDFFGSTCMAKNGSYTKDALNKALVLAETLRGIKDDADCSPLSAAESQATSISAALAVLEKTKGDNEDYSAQEQAILSQMAVTTNPAQIASLQDLLVKINVSKKLSNYDEQAIAARSMVLETNTLVQQVVSNQACIFKKPSILAAVGSLVSSVGVAATAVNPAIGLGAAVGGNMLSNLVKLVNQSRFAKQIRKAKEQTLMPEALSCVMESLSSDYCRANDAVAALDWKQAHQKPTAYPVTSSAYAMTLVDREIPTLMDWLTTLKVAAKSQNTYDASQVSDFKAREALYESSPSLASGVIESTNMNPNDSSDVKWASLSRAIKNLVGTLWGPSNPYGGSDSVSKNPLFLVYTSEQAMFYLVGFAPSEIPVSNGKQISFNEFNPNIPVPPYKPALPSTGISYDLTRLTKRFNDWFALAQDQVNVERGRVLRQDPQLILENAFKDQQTQQRISPYQAINNLVMFLTTQQDTNPDASESYYLLTDTINRLTQIRQSLDMIHTVSWRGRTKDDYSALLGEVYKMAELGSGVVFMGDRLKSHADSALVRYLTQKPTPADQSVLAQTLASNKMTEILLLTNAGKDRGEIRDDIVNSMTITLPTFDSFIQNYQRNIRDVLEDLLAQEKQYGAKEGAAFNSKRAHLCLLLVQAKQWPSEISFDLCSGTSLTLLKGGPQSSVLTDAVLTQKLEDRSCKLYNLRRDTKIYDTRTSFEN